MSDDVNKSDVESENASSAPTSPEPELPVPSEGSSAQSADDNEDNTTAKIAVGRELLVPDVVATERSVSDVETVTRKRFDGVEVVFVSQDTQTTCQEGSSSNQKPARGDIVTNEEVVQKSSSDQRVEEPAIGQGQGQGQTDVSREQSVLNEEFKERDSFYREESFQLNLGTDEKFPGEPSQDPQGEEFEANVKYVDYDPNVQDEGEDEEEEGSDGEYDAEMGDSYMGAGEDAETLVTEDSGVPPLRDLEGLEGCETVGPPRILRFNRESSKPDLDYPPLTDREKEEGIFGGSCDFCGNAIKSYPDMEKQLYRHSREIFCCDDYQIFMQYALQKPFGKKYDVDVQKFVTSLLDIQPHAPYNKQARKAAKEKAAMRMRERELERQKKAVTQQQPQQQQQQQTYQQAAESQKALKVINFSLGSKKCAEQGYIVDSKPQNEFLSPLPVGARLSVDLSSEIPLTERSVPLKNRFEQRFYASKKKQLFYVFFDDGTGTVYYKSGRPCIIISTVEKLPTGQKSQHGSKSGREFESQSKTHRSVTQISRANSRKTEGGLASTRRPTNASGTEIWEETERRMQAAKLQYIVLSDEPRASVLAVFMPDGNAACYDSNRQLRLHLSPFGGILFGDNLSRKRRWNWHDFSSGTPASSQDQHQLAPPLQPVFLPIGNALSLKITNQHLLWLTFRSGKYNVRLNVGVRLKITGAQKTELPKMLEKTKDVEYLNDMQTYTQSILNRVNNLLKYKNEELAEKLPPPLYLSHQMEKRQIQGPPKYGTRKQAAGPSPQKGRLLQSVDIEENCETIRT